MHRDEFWRLSEQVLRRQAERLALDDPDRLLKTSAANRRSRQAAPGLHAGRTSRFRGAAGQRGGAGSSKLRFSSRLSNQCLRSSAIRFLPETP